MPMDNIGIVHIDDNLLDYKLKTKRLNKKKLFHCFINLIQDGTFKNCFIRSHMLYMIVCNPGGPNNLLMVLLQSNTDEASTAGSLQQTSLYSNHLNKRSK